MQRPVAAVAVPPSVDPRLIALTKRAFRVTMQLPREAFVDHLQVVLGCSRTQALHHLEDLAQGGWVLVRGTSTAALVFAGADMATESLVARGIDVRRRP